MAKPDTTPLYVQIPGGRAIVQDAAQKDLDHARGLYRRQYDRGYSLSERGEPDKAQGILDRANKALREAEWAYHEARARGGRTL